MDSLQRDLCVEETEYFKRLTGAKFSNRDVVDMTTPDVQFAQAVDSAQMRASNRGDIRAIKTQASEPRKRFEVTKSMIRDAGAGKVQLVQARALANIPERVIRQLQAVQVEPFELPQPPHKAESVGRDSAPAQVETFYIGQSCDRPNGRVRGATIRKKDSVY